MSHRRRTQNRLTLASLWAKLNHVTQVLHLCFHVKHLTIQFKQHERFVKQCSLCVHLKQKHAASSSSNETNYVCAFWSNYVRFDFMSSWPARKTVKQFMNYFTSKIDTIRDQIVTMQPPAAVSHQIVHYRSPEEQFYSFSTIGEEEWYKLVKSATCMLDPIPSKLLKEVLPEVMDPLLAIIIRHCH